MQMRKVIIEIEPYEAVREAQRPMFTHIHSYEVLEVLNLDHVKGLYVDLIECRLKENVSIEELSSIGNLEILSVVRSEGDRHICLVLGHETEETAGQVRGLGTEPHLHRPQPDIRGKGHRQLHQRTEGNDEIR